MKPILLDDIPDNESYQFDTFCPKCDKKYYFLTVENPQNNVYLKCDNCESYIALDWQQAAKKKLWN